MQKRLLDYDPTTGISTYHHYDDMTDKTTIEEVADLQDLNKFRQDLRKDDGYSKDGIKGGHWHVATIHQIEQVKFLRKYGFSVFEHGREKEVHKILNTDPEFQLCKVTKGSHA